MDVYDHPSIVVHGSFGFIPAYYNLALGWHNLGYLLVQKSTLLGYINITFDKQVMNFKDDYWSKFIPSNHQVKQSQLSGKRNLEPLATNSRRNLQKREEKTVYRIPCLIKWCSRTWDHDLNYFVVFSSVCNFMYFVHFEII